MARKRSPEVGYYQTASGRVRCRLPDGTTAAEMETYRAAWELWQSSWRSSPALIDLLKGARPDIEWSGKLAVWLPGTYGAPPLPRGAINPYDRAEAEAAKYRVMDQDIAGDQAGFYRQFSDKYFAILQDITVSAERLQGKRPLNAHLEVMAEVSADALRQLYTFCDEFAAAAPMLQRVKLEGKMTQDRDAYFDGLARAVDNMKLKRAASPTIDEMNIRSGRTKPADAYAPPADVTLAQVIDAYLAAEKTRIGQRVDGISEATWSGYRKGVLGGVGLGTGTGERVADASTRAVVREVPGVALDAPLRMVDDYALDQLKKFWYGEKSGVSLRAASNAIGGIGACLRWAAKQKVYGWSLPSNASTTLVTRQPKGKVEGYDPARLRRWIDAAGKTVWRCRLLLFLNCGYRAVDIVRLKVGDLQRDADGNWCLFRKRPKTHHQNDWESLHTLWPETLAELQKYTADRAPGEFIFPAPGGGPLEWESLSSDYVKGLRQKVGGDMLQLQQWRKIGASYIRTLTQNIIVQSCYLADGSGAPGVLGSYTREDWTKTLSPALVAMRAGMIADGVFDAVA